MSDTPQPPLQSTKPAEPTAQAVNIPANKHQEGHVKVFVTIGAITICFAIFSYYMAWNTFKEAPVKITIADQQAISSIINTTKQLAPSLKPQAGDEIIKPEALAVAPQVISTTENTKIPIISEENPQPELLVELAKKTADMPKYELNAEIVIGIPKNAPRIALIFDDLGVLGKNSLKVIEEMPKEITLSFLPHGKHTNEYATKARNLHHEIMIHLPMEALARKNGKIINPGKNALYTEDDLNQIRNKLTTNYKFLSNLAVGVNNHMGSKFTMWQAGMEEVLKITAEEKLMFLDSVTTGKTVGTKAHNNVTKLGSSLPFLKRDVFIDHVKDKAEIMKYLNKLEKIASKKGYAIGIGHPHVKTIAAVKEWLPTLAEKGIYLVPISNLIPLVGSNK